jgi:hypothetical protein
MDRYAGQPFLRLLECYVLDAIDQLDDSQRNTLQLMEPKLEKLYGVPGTWKEIVGAQMDFPQAFPEKIRDVWNKNLALAREHGAAVDPNEFAKAFVDQNLHRKGDGG